MKKTSLFLATGLLVLSLASCGGNNDGRKRDIAPAGGETVDTDNGISKLSKAVKATPMQDVWSVKLSDESTFHASGTVSEAYNEESDKDKNTTNTFDIGVTNPVFDARFEGFNGAEVANIKASVKMGGDISLTTKENDDEAISVKTNGVALNVYVDSKMVYVDPRGAKKFCSDMLNAYMSDMGPFISGLTSSYLNSGYYFVHNLTNDNMPLINSEMTSDIDNYLALFSDHAEDYKDFLNITKNGDEYYFYITMTKEDLIRVMNDAQNKYADESFSQASADFAEELKDSTVNACEFLVSFTEESITGVSYNIDMDVNTVTDITVTDSAGNDAVIGKTTSQIHYVSKGAATFGTEAPVIPAETKNFKDGEEELGSLMEMIKSIIGDSGIGDIIGDIIGDLPFSF